MDYVKTNTKKSKIRIALISLQDEEREFYQSLLAPYDQVAVESYQTLAQFKKECAGKKYSGVIIDMYTIVAASTAEKDFFFSVQHGFPVMQIRRVLESGEIKGLVNQKAAAGLSGVRILESFVESDCRKFPPRGVRIYERKKILMQIHFFLTQDDQPIKSEMMNISQGGCFILSPPANLAEENRFWIVMEDLQDKKPIPCLVRWKGDRLVKEKNLIEVGAQFEELTPEQQEEILEIIKAAAPESSLS